MVLPEFLSIPRLHRYYNNICQPHCLSAAILLNLPTIYTLCSNRFDAHIFVFSYFLCGIFQGCINSGLYYISDIAFSGKVIDEDEWKKNRFYDNVIYNTDTTYFYALGSMAYFSCVVVPDTLRWSFDFPGYASVAIQFFYVILFHDLFFTTMHYGVHKIPPLRTVHIKMHNECPFRIAGGRCAIATESFEGIFLDLYSATFATYIIGYLFQPFYGYLWIPYYSAYSFWSMYIHTGKNKYHLIHHTTTPYSNYGLYYFTDYLIGTLDITSGGGRLRRR